MPLGCSGLNSQETRFSFSNLTEPSNATRKSASTLKVSCKALRIRRDLRVNQELALVPSCPFEVYDTYALYEEQNFLLLCSEWIIPKLLFFAQYFFPSIIQLSIGSCWDKNVGCKNSDFLSPDHSYFVFFFFLFSFRDNDGFIPSEVLTV